jgi:hypothetical protein
MGEDNPLNVMLAGFTHPPVVELTERLATFTGLGHRLVLAQRGQRHLGL